MLLRAVLVAFLLAPAAQAGPWPEPTNGTFIRLTEDFAEGSDPSNTQLFVESSGRHSFFLGVDSERSADTEDWSAYAFIRQPLSAETSPDKFAVSAGVGAQQSDGDSEPLVVVGGIWGRDLSGNVTGGWVSLEGDVRYGTTSGQTELTGGAIVAVEPVDRIAFVNEVSVSGVPGSSETAETLLTTSIVGSVSASARVQLGATIDLSGDTATGFRLGTWLEF